LTIAALLQPSIASLGDMSQLYAGRSAVLGIVEIANTMAPGVSVRLGYQNDPASPPIELRGHIISTEIVGRTISEHCRWILPTMSLHPGRSYQLTRVGDRIEVFEVV
jgi:hypothetical protein